MIPTGWKPDTSCLTSLSMDLKRLGSTFSSGFITGYKDSLPPHEGRQAAVQIAQKAYAISVLGGF